MTLPSHCVFHLYETANLQMCIHLCRLLTQEEIAQRRELARQRHADRLAADQAATESHKDLTHSGSMPQEDERMGLSTGKLTSPHAGPFYL